ncbi:hypothetical protein ABZP36_032008 [Zizania latifolia]
MGNCQAAEAATVVIQHPGGRVERLCWSTSAAEVMRANPGHYVALVTLRVAEERQDGEGGARRTVRFTRVKLLKPKETLLLGHAYRLITTHDVTKAMEARKEEKQRKAQQQLLESRQKKTQARPAEDNDDDEEALDASLDQLAIVLRLHTVKLSLAPQDGRVAWESSHESVIVLGAKFAIISSFPVTDAPADGGIIIRAFRGSGAASVAAVAAPAVGGVVAAAPAVEEKKLISPTLQGKYPSGSQAQCLYLASLQACRHSFRILKAEAGYNLEGELNWRGRFVSEVADPRHHPPPHPFYRHFFGDMNILIDAFGFLQLDFVTLVVFYSLMFKPSKEKCCVLA